MSITRPSGAEPAQQPDPTRPRLVTAALVACAALYAFVQNLVAPAVPAMEAHFGIDVVLGGLVYSVFLASASIGIALAGCLARYLGGRVVLLISLGLATAGGVITVLAPAYEWLIIGRALQGLLGMTLPVTIAIARDRFDPAAAARIVALLSGSLGLGGCIGILVAGPLTELYSYRAVLVAAVVVTALASVAAVAIGRGAAVLPGRADWIGFALTSAGVLAIALSIDLVPRLLPDATMWSMVAAVVALLAFLTAYLRGLRRGPSVSLRVRWSWTVSTLCALLGGVVLFVLFGLVPYVVETPTAEASWGLGLSALVTSVCLFLFNGGLYAGGIVSGALTRRHSPTRLIQAGALVSLVGVGLALLPGRSVWTLVVVCAIVGTGVGVMQAVAPLMNMHQVDVSDSARAAGVSRIAKNLGSVVGGQVVALALAASLPSWLGADRVSVALLAALVAIGVCIVLTFTVRVHMSFGQAEPSW